MIKNNKNKLSQVLGRKRYSNFLEKSTIINKTQFNKENLSEQAHD